MNEHELKEVSVRLVLKEQTSYYSDVPITDPISAVSVMTEVLKELDREVFCVVNLDVRGRPINYNIVSMGGLDTSIVPISNVFKSTILSNSEKVIIFHNHPSGDPTPSDTDIYTTEKIVYAGKLLGITVEDHIIIGGMSGRMYSMRSNDNSLFDPYLDLDEAKSVVFHK